MFGGRLCCQFRDHAIRRGVVPDIEQTVLDTTQLAVRTGVDGALHHDGRCSVAGVAGGQFKDGAVPVLRTIAFEHSLVVSVLWRAVTILGADQHCADVVGHCDHHFCICHALAPRSIFDGALYLLGQLGHCPERFDLHAELMPTGILWRNPLKPQL